MKHLPKSIQKKCHTDNETIHTTSTISMIYEWDLLVIQIIARIYSLSWYSGKTQLKTIILRLIWHYCFKGKRTLNLLGLRTCFSDNLWHSKHLIMKKKKLWNLTKETIYPSSNLQIHARYMSIKSWLLTFFMVLLKQVLCSSMDAWINSSTWSLKSSKKVVASSFFFFRHDSISGFFFGGSILTSA